MVSAAKLQHVKFMAEFLAQKLQDPLQSVEKRYCMFAQLSYKSHVLSGRGREAIDHR